MATANMDGERLLFILHDADAPQASKEEALAELVRREERFRTMRGKIGSHLGREIIGLSDTEFGNESVAALVALCIGNTHDAADLAVRVTVLLCDPQAGTKGPLTGAMHLAFGLPHFLPAAGFAAYVAAGLKECAETHAEPYRVVHARSWHLDEILDLYKSQLGADADAGRYIRRLVETDRDQNFIFVALDGAKVAGFIYGEHFRYYTVRQRTHALDTDFMFRGQVHVNTIVVGAGHTRNGIGRALMLRAAQTLQEADAEIALEVRESNMGARAFYEGLGMERGRINDPAYYGKRKRGQTSADVAAVSYVATVSSLVAREAARVPCQ
jgi:ribosomal protein S18 acetylase RimI-like enzyme